MEENKIRGGSLVQSPEVSQRDGCFQAVGIKAELIVKSHFKVLCVVLISEVSVDIISTSYREFRHLTTNLVKSSRFKTTELSLAKVDQINPEILKQEARSEIGGKESRRDR